MFPGYAIHDEYLGYIITAYPPARDVTGFIDCIKSSIDDLKSVLDQTEKKD